MIREHRTIHIFVITALADRLIKEARESIGGPVAWGRLSHDAQIDAVRARAWLVVQARTESVADVSDAMEDVYSRAVLA